MFEQNQYMIPCDTHLKKFKTSLEKKEESNPPSFQDFNQIQLSYITLTAFCTICGGISCFSLQIKLTGLLP